jgi:hypothetical protein
MPLAGQGSQSEVQAHRIFALSLDIARWIPTEDGRSMERNHVTITWSHGKDYIIESMVPSQLVRILRKLLTPFLECKSGQRVLK